MTRNLELKYNQNPEGCQQNAGRAFLLEIQRSFASFQRCKKGNVSDRSSAGHTSPFLDKTGVPLLREQAIVGYFEPFIAF
jgi:hypothetical protein